MLVKTDAIVLRSMKYRDTSKIVTFYTREFGKIKGIAKGARAAKNKFGSSLEPMTRSHLVVYKKENRDLHLVSQCDAVETRKNILKDLDRLTTAFSALEMVDRISHDEDRNPPLFTLLEETLRALDAASEHYSLILDAFRLRTSALFGYAPNFETCGQCGTPVRPEEAAYFAFHLSRGAVFCPKCRTIGDDSDGAPDSAYRVCSADVLVILRALVAAPMEEVSRIPCRSAAGNKIDELVRLYVRYHFSEVKDSHTAKLYHHSKSF